MFSSIKAATLAVIAVAASKALAESHTITFENKCGFGTPTLISEGGAVLSTGAPYTSGPLIGAIAYLQTVRTPITTGLRGRVRGSCGLYGQNCTVVEITLMNPTTPGTGSICDISLIPPHAFSLTTGFDYLGACSGAGADCTNPYCTTAFKEPTDHSEAVACQADDANLVVLFCS
ncbi:hypothetical protein C8R45DRAFT_1108656 [Mycena sanguinolenta]|nr:hypothetical protein C8R45DRAFT_1108656 [Mycena sanguinolenta]